MFPLWWSRFRAALVYSKAVGSDQRELPSSKEAGGDTLCSSRDVHAAPAIQPELAKKGMSKVALRNLALRVRDHAVPASSPHATWQRVAPFSDAQASPTREAQRQSPPLQPASSTYFC